jgi:cytosine deaminase
MLGEPDMATRVGERASPTLIVRNAALLDQDGYWDVVIEDGTITEVVAGRAASEGEEIDAAGGLVTRSFVEPHFHPDKALTRPRLGPGAANDLDAKMRRGAEIKRGYTVDDVKTRAREALRLAVAHGIGTMRAQVDVDTVCGLVGIEAMLDLRNEFRDTLDLQLVAFPQEGIVRDPGAAELVAAAIEMGADIVGGGPNNEDSNADWGPHVTTLLNIAGRFDAPADIHIDLSEDPRQRTLELLAEQAIARGMQGKVNASHCCALAAYPDAHARLAIDQVKRAGIQVCICPMGNLLSAYGRGRGASRPKELLQAGVNVAAGSDNLYDMWYRFGRLDPVELAFITCLAAGMRTDAEVREAFAMTTTRAAAYTCIPPGGPIAGAHADLVIFSTATLDDVLRNLPGRRITLKHGRIVGGLDSCTWVTHVGESPATAHIPG